MGLRRRAADLLAAGPAPTGRIARRVLGLSGNPEAADAAVRALLGPDDRFVSDGDGVWRLRDPGHDAGDGLGALEYAVVDVETTGGSPRNGDRITEIAIVEVAAGEIAGSYTTLVNPRRPIPRAVVRITGITDEMVAAAPPFRAVADEVRRRLAGRVFVAHNVTFDWRFVRAELAEATGEAVAPRMLCTVRMTRRLVPELRRRNLDRVAAHFGVEIADRHRARGDAVATARILRLLLDGARERGVRTWRGLQALLDGRKAEPEAEPEGEPEGNRREDGESGGER